MTSHSTPQASFVTPEAAKKLATTPGTLALIGFGGPRDAGDGQSPWIGTGLEPLAPPPVQAWRANTPVEYGRLGNFTVRTTPGFALLATTLQNPEDPEPAADELYRELIAAAARLGCPHLLRIWQYLPRITESRHGEDRYRAYCAGRARAFEETDAGDAALPAACLLGDAGERILLYALIADKPGRQIENPRQQSAFRYPLRYGRKSPSFSRATAFGTSGEETLFISGTSSITGHASRHTKTLDQLEETLRNLEALVKNWHSNAGGLAAIAPLKVYLRHASDLDAVRAALAKRLPEGLAVAYLRADVCRPELNVEIEGIVQP
ncbi:MAG: pteridine-dependent deoxygenase [Gammaproteobacteria bacterium]